MDLIAYLDTNIYDNLVKKTGGVSATDEQLLRAAVSSKRLTIVASHWNIIETLAALPSRPEIARTQLGLIADLIDWDRLVRFQSSILHDDVKHFAFNGEQANSVFEGSAASVRAKVRGVIDGSIGIEELTAVLVENSDSKQAFIEGLKNSRAETISELEKLRESGEIPTFGQWFEESAGDWARVFTKSFGVADECERRGLANLLRIPSIRAMVGLGMSFIYRTAVEGKAAKGSATRDLQHVVCAAAAADIFVTHDAELIALLSRARVDRLRVAGLGDLLADQSNTARS